MRDERKPEDFIGKSVRSGEERSAMPNTFVSEDSAIEDGGFPGDLQIPSLAPRKKEKRCIKNPIVSNESGSPQQNMEEQVSVKNEKAVDSREAKESEENIAAKKMGASEIAEILMSEHRFCSDGSQLYLYDIQDGYWKMLQESEANREIRKLIPENVRPYVNKIVLREIYEWIRIDASPSSGDEDRRKDYINFRDCAVNWQTGKVCKAREKLYFTYALKVEYVKGNPMPKGAYHDFLKDSNDTLTACFKGKDHFQFKNECLMVFACNSFPSIQAIEEFDVFRAHNHFPLYQCKAAQPVDQWLGEPFIGRFRRDYQRCNEGLAGDGGGRLCF